MAGLPAMGEHHSDDDIWGIVAIIETLPEMSPEQYATLRAARVHDATPHKH